MPFVPPGSKPDLLLEESLHTCPNSRHRMGGGLSLPSLQVESRQLQRRLMSLSSWAKRPETTFFSALAHCSSLLAGLNWGRACFTGRDPLPQAPLSLSYSTTSLHTSGTSRAEAVLEDREWRVAQAGSVAQSGSSRGCEPFRCHRVREGGMGSQIHGGKNKTT